MKIVYPQTVERNSVAPSAATMIPLQLTASLNSLYRLVPVRNLKIEFGKSRMSRGLLFVCLAICVALFVGGWLKRSSENSSLVNAQRQIHFQFEATSRFLAFPIILREGAIGFVWIDRSSRERKLIQVPGSLLLFPSISKDQNHLLFVKRDQQSSTREIVRCTVLGWRCSSLLKTNDPIYSPVDVGDEGVLFAASGLRKANDGKFRYDAFHLFYLEKGSSFAKQLTRASFYSIGSLQFVNGDIFFSGTSKESSFGDALFKVGFDSERKDIIDPQDLMRPLTLLSGASMLPSRSDQSAVFAFLHMGSLIEYDLAIDRPRTGIVVNKKTGLGFSKPVVLGEDVLVNELLESEYVISAYRPDGRVEVLDRLSRLPSDIEKLSRVSLSFDK